MSRTVAIPCGLCHRRLSGDETYRKHQRIAGDGRRCLSDRELMERGWYQDRDYVWHRPTGATAKVSARVRPTENGAATLFDESGVTSTEPRKLARFSDPTTSARAAKAIAPRTGSLKALLLGIYREAPDGLTDEEAAARAGLTLYQATKRCADLRNDGWIVPDGERRGASGQMRQICRAVVAEVSA